MKLTHHSEYGIIKSIYLKHVKDSFTSPNKISAQWKQLNYLGEPDYASAVEEYKQFEALIRSTEATIFYFDNDPSLTLDSIYCRDASIATDYGMIICNMGKADRMHEPASESNYINNGEQILGRIVIPGKVEGGDVCWLNETTLAVGHTYRTNIQGINQLKSFLEPNGISVITVDLPHYKGPSDVFHLMSILSPVDKDLCVVYSPLMPVSFRNILLDMGMDLVEVPDEEFDSMGCNVLALAPRRCLMVSGNPVTIERLEKAGSTVIAYQGQEISVKGGGGPTCLTRPIIRMV